MFLFDFLLSQDVLADGSVSKQSVEVKCVTEGALLSAHLWVYMYRIVIECHCKGGGNRRDVFDRTALRPKELYCNDYTSILIILLKF